RAPLPTPAERLLGSRERRRQPARVAQARQLAREFRLLPGAQPGLDELLVGGLPAVPLFARPVELPLERFARRSRSAPPGERRGAPLAWSGKRRPAVEEIALAVAREKRRVIVLPVEFDQPGPEFGQRPHRDGHLVHPRAAPALARDLATHDDL